MTSGFVIVPRAPTDDMWEAGRVTNQVLPRDSSNVYRAMIAARPPLPEGMREKIARTILGPKSQWNLYADQYGSLLRWTQYPHIVAALDKATTILALLDERSPP